MPDTKSLKPDKRRTLRKGWTTGACATAATRAAYGALLTGSFEDPVSITLPRGQTPSFALSESALRGGAAMAAIVKDAGDDPDVTHGALIRATVRLGEPGAGVIFRAGEGVGTVTLAGLPVAVGEPAINPAPRRMMTAVVAELAALHGAAGDVEITIAVDHGERLAERTMNARLGIIGGLSILGTTGIVTPYSCAAWIASIHQGVDVARAAGLEHVAGATGKTSESAVRFGASFSYVCTVRSLAQRGGKVTGVETDRGAETAEAVVLSLGCHSAELLRPLGLRVPIYPVKGYSQTLLADGAGAPRMAIQDVAGKTGITPFGARVRSAGTAELDGFDKRADAKRAAAMLGDLMEILPNCGDPGKAELWTGLRPMTPDCAPIIGRTRIENLYLDTGHGSLGWTLACGSAAVIADIVSGRPPAVDLSGFTIDRFL